MKRDLIAWVLILLMPCVMYAQEIGKNEQTLYELYLELLKERNCQITDVKFTGNDFEKAGGGFIWQRGDGAGWTKGKRLVISKADTVKVAVVRQTFMNLAKKQRVNIQGRLCASTFMEDVRTIYAYEYDKVQNTLYFLRAKAEQQVSVPISWKTADVVNATKTVHKFYGYGKATAKEMCQLGLARLWAGIQRNFVFMDRIKFNYDSLYVVTVPQMNQVKSYDQAVRILQRFAAAVGDGHTYVYGYSPNGVTAKFSTQYLNGKVYVKSVFEKGLQAKGIKRGDELVAINRIPVLAYGQKEVMPYVSSSTPQWTLHATYDNQSLLRFKKDEKLILNFKTTQGKSVEVAYDPQQAEALPITQDVMTFSKLKGNIGYLKINSFWSNGNYGNVFLSLYPEIMKTKALIVDVRNNSGGNSGNSDFVLRHLTNDTIQSTPWTSPIYIPAYVSWGIKTDSVRSGIKKLSPVWERPVYVNPVALLVDGGTFSAAEDFCVMFKALKRGPIIGSTTAGSTGNGVRIQLIPGICEANICSKYDKGPDGTDFVGKGIVPDIEVVETYKSCFKDKHDAAITEALKYLQTKL